MCVSPPRGLNVCAVCASSSFSWAWCVPSYWVQVAPLAEAAVVQGQLSCPGQTPTVGTVLPGSRNRIILSAGTHTRDAPLPLSFLASSLCGHTHPCP